MITSKTLGSRISQAVIWVLVIAMALICLLPLLNMVAISFSSSTAASANIVGIYPVNPTLESYTKLLAMHSSGVLSAFRCCVLFWVHR